MCTKGDIILIDSYKSNGVVLPKHTFIVIDDSGGEIESLSFDYIATVMSSEKSIDQLKRKLNYPGNFPIAATEQTITDPPGGNKKNGYTKCEQFYYFKKEKITYKVIGKLNSGVLDIVLDYINELIDNHVEFEHIIDNLNSWSD